MSARAAVYPLLIGDLELQTLGVNAGSVFGTNDVDTPEVRPFIVLRWEDVTRAFGTLLPGPRNLTVWIHDEGSDYTRIDSILSRVKELLTGVVDQGAVSQIGWTGDSGDLYDDGYKTITRNSGFTVGNRVTG